MSRFSIVMLSVVILNVVMLSVVILNVVMASVVALRFLAMAYIDQGLIKKLFTILINYLAY
jgi:hypothetical protein